MTAENFDTLMRQYLDARPFKVFTVELNGGQRFEVDHPGAMLVREGLAVFIAPGAVPYWVDHESILQIIGDRVQKADSA